MVVFFGWIVFSIVVAIIGNDRKIGGGAAFAISLFLSPLIGLIFVLTSPTLASVKYQEEMLKKNTTHEPVTPSSVSDELEKLAKLRDNGTIDEVEFQKLKRKLMD